MLPSGFLKKATRAGEWTLYQHYAPAPLGEMFAPAALTFEVRPPGGPLPRHATPRHATRHATPRHGASPSTLLGCGEASIVSHATRHATPRHAAYLHTNLLTPVGPLTSR